MIDILLVMYMLHIKLGTVDKKKTIDNIHSGIKICMCCWTISLIVNNSYKMSMLLNMWHKELGNLHIFITKD